jgi:hypothetical protein
VESGDSNPGRERRPGFSWRGEPLGISSASLGLAGAVLRYAGRESDRRSGKGYRCDVECQWGQASDRQDRNYSSQTAVEILYPVALLLFPSRLVRLPLVSPTMRMTGIENAAVGGSEAW